MSDTFGSNAPAPAGAEEKAATVPGAVPGQDSPAVPRKGLLARIADAVARVQKSAWRRATYY